MALIMVFLKYVYKDPFNIFAYLISKFNFPIILFGIEMMSEFKFLDGRWVNIWGEILSLILL